MLGKFYVRLTLRQEGDHNFELGQLYTTLDLFLDSGTGEWLIPRYAALVNT